MPFGKYKNKPINEIDPTSSEWVLANCQQISPALKRAICTKLRLDVKDDPKDKEIADLQAAMTELRQTNLVSRLEAYDQRERVRTSRTKSTSSRWLFLVYGSRTTQIPILFFGCFILFAGASPRSDCDLERSDKQGIH